MKYLSLFAFSFMLLAFNKPVVPIEEVFITQNGRISMVFDLNLGKTTAKTNTASSVYELANGKVDFTIALQTFQFSNILVEYQFKETYLEVSKYPNATFKGRMREKLNTKIKTPQKVTIDGFLDMHGVIQKRTIVAEMTCQERNIQAKSEFTIRPSDHKIAIPKAFFVNEKDLINVNFEANYNKKQ